MPSSSAWAHRAQRAESTFDRVAEQTRQRDEQRQKAPARGDVVGRCGGLLGHALRIAETGGAVAPRDPKTGRRDPAGPSCYRVAMNQGVLAAGATLLVLAGAVAIWPTLQASSQLPRKGEWILDDDPGTRLRIDRPTTHALTHDRVNGQTVGVIHILVSGQPTKHRLPEQAVVIPWKAERSRDQAGDAPADFAR